MKVSFAARFGNVISLSSALCDAGQDPSQGQQQAKSLEAGIFEKATTKEDYQAEVDRLRAHLQPSPVQKGQVISPIDPEDIFNEDGPTFGDFFHATFHRDGQTSTVFKARAPESFSVKIVALKMTTLSLIKAPHNSVREARLLEVCRHDAVVPLLDSFHEGGRFIMVFRFLRQDLENLLRTDSLSQRQSSMVFKALFEALSHIHSLGIIHRDVKPSNILLGAMNGPVYLTDFGIAWSPCGKDSEPADDKITDVGTTCYRPPELLFGDRAYSTSLDIWAAGCVVAEMVKKGHYPVFDAGPLGSELGLIKSMFTTLGTPNDESWPSARTYPDWNKMQFQQFPAQPWQEILPSASTTAIDFVSRTVCFESTRRLTAADALNHPLAQQWETHYPTLGIANPSVTMDSQSLSLQYGGLRDA